MIIKQAAMFTLLILAVVGVFCIGSPTQPQYREQSASQVQSQAARVQPLAEETGPALGVVARCRIVDWTDGDTLTVDVTFRSRVRLLDCWAPEIHGIEKPAGLAALAFVRDKWPPGTRARLHVPTGYADRTDDVLTFGRVLGRIYVDGEEVSPLIVKAGHATKDKQK